MWCVDVTGIGSAVECSVTGTGSAVECRVTGTGSTVETGGLTGTTTVAVDVDTDEDGATGTGSTCLACGTGTGRMVEVVAETGLEQIIQRHAFKMIIYKFNINYHTQNNQILGIRIHCISNRYAKRSSLIFSF